MAPMTFRGFDWEAKCEVAGNYSCVMAACQSCLPKLLLFQPIALHVPSWCIHFFKVWNPGPLSCSQTTAQYYQKTYQFPLGGSWRQMQLMLIEFTCTVKKKRKSIKATAPYTFTFRGNVQPCNELAKKHVLYKPAKPF